MRNGTTKFSAYFKNSAQMLSSPDAFPAFKFFIACRTSCSVMGLSSSGMNLSLLLPCSLKVVLPYFNIDFRLFLSFSSRTSNGFPKLVAVPFIV